MITKLRDLIWIPFRSKGSKSVASTKKIAHIDMDTFYPAAEVLRHPELKGKPVIVGGLGRRGVVASASMEARSYGVKAAMPISIARRMCPEGNFLPGDHAYYIGISKRIMRIFYDFTPYLEPLSLDEAFLDLSGAVKAVGTPLEIAQKIRHRVKAEEGLICSVGLASNKHTAKVACSLVKSRIEGVQIVPGKGILSVPEGKEAEFLRPLPIRALWGCGAKLQEKLRSYGITKVGHICDISLSSLENILGKANAVHLRTLAEGRDAREVESASVSKSISEEETFSEDVSSRTELESHLVQMGQSLSRRLRKGGFKTDQIILKLRYGADFSTITRSKTLLEATDSGPLIWRSAKEIFKNQDLRDGIRLIGMSLRCRSGEAETFDSQLSLEVEPEGKILKMQAWQKVERAIDFLQDKYENPVVLMGSGISNSDKAIAGKTPWGPR